LSIVFFLLGFWVVKFGLYYSCGHIDNVLCDYGTPELYTSDEVQAAGDLVLEDFKSSGGFKGCRLNVLAYDEEASRGISQEDNVDTIVFCAYFKTGFIWNGNDYNANSDEYCMWYLERKDADSDWEIQSAGVP
jgi:hypothetical protein